MREEFLTQPLFMLKMGLILAGGLNAAILHTGPLRATGPDFDAHPTPGVRMAAAFVAGPLARRHRLRTFPRVPVAHITKRAETGAVWKCP